MERPVIFSYLDYRSFCRDFYKSQKEEDSKFSYRSFGRRAGVAPASLKHVIDGKRNLSSEMSYRFAEGMGLGPKETNYFVDLVHFSQASNLEEKNIYLERLRRKRARTLQNFGLAEAALLLSHWYVIAIKELVVALNTTEVELIQSLLRKRLPEATIKESIDQLIGMGYLVEDDSGRWRSSVAQVQFPDEMKSFVIRSFHGQMLSLAMEALEDDLGQREFGSTVFTFPKSKLPELKEKIKELQRDLISYVQDESNSVDDSGSHIVMVFGTQCFSLQRVE